MENMVHCRVHPGKPAEYMCQVCRNLPLCGACKRDHKAETGHAPDNCKEVGMALMHQRIQDANGRNAKALAKGLRKALKELKTVLLREIDRLQLSCIPTEKLRKMKKLDIEGRYAELYLYAKSLPTDKVKNKAATGELSKRLIKMIDTTSSELKKVLSEVVASVAQYKPVFAAYKKDEVFVFKSIYCKDEEMVMSALKAADTSKLKAVYIDSFSVVGDRVASELASRLQTHPISALYLAGLNISDAGAETLARAAFRGKSLSAFCIVCSEISDTGAMAVAVTARNCPSLTTFYLHGGGISDSGARAVAEMVKSCPLSVFYIGSCKISDSGAKAVAEEVKDYPLSAFYLYGGKISDAGAISVANTVKDCPLSALYLAGNRISDAGATAVAETLSSGRCASALTAFYIRIDNASNSGAKKVADAIRGCTKLSAFYLDGVPISGETLAYILEGMISTIRSVNLHIGKIRKEKMDSCLDRLQHSGVAKQLKLRFQCDTEAAKSVCEKFAAEWGAKLSEFRIVPYIIELFEEDVILGVPK